jgi:hypothetical protein
MMTSSAVAETLILKENALADQEVGCHRCTLLVIYHTPILISRALQGLKLARPKWPEQEQERKAGL